MCEKVIDNFLKESLFNVFGRPVVVLTTNGFELQNSKEKKQWKHKGVKGNIENKAF